MDFTNKTLVCSFYLFHNLRNTITSVCVFIYFNENNKMIPLEILINVIDVLVYLFTYPYPHPLAE